jgi:hypothetical protein
VRKLHDESLLLEGMPEQALAAAQDPLQGVQDEEAAADLATQPDAQGE